MKDRNTFMVYLNKCSCCGTDINSNLQHLISEVCMFNVGPLLTPCFCHLTINYGENYNYNYRELNKQQATVSPPKKHTLTLLLGDLTDTFHPG